MKIIFRMHKLIFDPSNSSNQINQKSVWMDPFFWQFGNSCAILCYKSEVMLQLVITLYIFFYSPLVFPVQTDAQQGAEPFFGVEQVWQPNLRIHLFHFLG